MGRNKLGLERKKKKKSFFEKRGLCLIRGDSGEKNNLGEEGVRATVRKIKNKK